MPAPRSLPTARLADPLDPAPARALAAITWVEILFAQGVATFEAFQGDGSGDTVQRPSVDRTLSGRFLQSATEAISLAERRVAGAPTDADALYQLGASTALLALYRATVEGRAWAAFVEGRRAVRTMELVRQCKQEHREAALIAGMYRYAVSTLSWPKRLLANAAGMPGDHVGGIALLETAAASSAETATDASLLLMIGYNREGRHADAMWHLHQPRERLPRNRLLVLNAAATTLAACDAAAAAASITKGLAAQPGFDQPRVLGERAMWYYLPALRARACVTGAAPTIYERRWQATRATGSAPDRTSDLPGWHCSSVTSDRPRSKSRRLADTADAEETTSPSKRQSSCGENGCRRQTRRGPRAPVSQQRDATPDVSVAPRPAGLRRAVPLDRRLDSVLTAPHEGHLYRGLRHTEVAAHPEVPSRIRAWYTAHGMFR